MAICVKITAIMKGKIQELLQEVLIKLNLPKDNIDVKFSQKENFGDYSSSIALQLSKKEKKPPMALAQKIVDEIDSSDIIEKVDIIKPGFINFWISNKYLISNLKKINDDFGKLDFNKNKNIIVEYSSPNIAKPFTIGHLRSTIIGDAIANLYTASAANVFRDNHLGDWGTQFGKQIYAIKTWGNEKEIENAKNPVKELVALYVKFHTEAENNPKIENDGRMWFKKLEDGDKEAVRLWKKCIDWSFKEFDKIYKKLNVHFTENGGKGYGESYFENKMKPIIEELERKHLLKESKGAKMIFFQNDKMPPLMIVKQDGATLYSTRDLATDKFRLENPRYGENPIIINEVGAEQSLYFKQIFETEKMLDWVKDGQRIHIKHGMYRFKDRKMSTRKGNTIWLEDVIEEAENRVKKIAKNNLTDESISKIAVGAIKWNDLKRSSHLDILFDWDEILNMQGNSCPYVQYTYVRCNSILSKKQNNEEVKISHLFLNDDEKNILRYLERFPEVVRDAVANFAPNYITTYLYNLCQKYNLFYQKHKVLAEKDENIKEFRILLTEKVSITIKNGLNLLGIETVEKM